MALITLCALGIGAALLLGKSDSEEEGSAWAKISEDTVTVAGEVYELFQAKYGNGKKGQRGYIKQSEAAALNLQPTDIPANFAGLEAVMVPTRLEEQLFRVVEVVENEDSVTITARHVWYDNLQNYTIWKPTKNTQYTVAETCRNVLQNTISPVNSRVASDCKDTVTHKETDFERKNLVEAFLDPEKGICAKYGLSLIRDNWDFYCLKSVGYNRGTVIQNGKNLLGVERTESIEHLVTRIAPIGKTKNGEIVWMNHNGLKYLDSNYINDYSYPRVEIYDTKLQIGKDDVTEQNIQDKLLQAAQKRFADDKVDLPEVQMKIEFLSLGDTEEYAQYRGLDKVYLYDIITIKDTIRGYNYTAQVIGVEHDILTGMLNSVTIGSLNGWDGTRKIATWQVPEVDGSNVRLKTIMAGSFESQAIQAGDIGDNVIAYAHIAQATIDELTSDSITAVTAQIHEIIAGSITAEDIQAGSITSIVIASNAITADKIDAGAVTATAIAADAVTADKIQAGAVTAVKIAADAVTADKIAANAVTAGKIAAGAIDADKIDATQISAINAKLGTATIANGYIANADIDFAHLKDAAIDEAIITTSITEKGIADRIFINRLMVTYGQMVEATIGDLVIGASDGNYYHVDVDWDDDGVPTLVPTQVDTPSAAEIAAGHTLEGKTIVGNVGTFAELSSEDFYAINGIIDRITAKRIDVDELWARQAFIGKLMTTDISSNTYIQSTIGTWTSGSTITQTINSLNSRISSLGYGTFFYSPTEPDPSGVVVGDVWVEPIDDQTWNDVSRYTWAELASFTWEQVAGQYRMYVWDGEQWKLLFDNLVINELTTEIAQTAYAVTLKADQSAVDTLSGDVTNFAATLEVQGQAITAAVSSVNQKTASYVRLTDPADDPNVTLSEGDTWVKAAGDGTWSSLEGYKWNQLSSLTWDELAGANVYVWNGSAWIQTDSYGAIVQNKTLIEQTQDAIKLEAQKREQLGNSLDVTRSALILANDRITAEVSRATSAEGGKIDKTTQYQTADAIVSEAVSQSGVNANANYIAKTTTYQTANSIVTEAVRQAGVNASNGFLAKTSTYQTADAIVTEAVRQARVNANSAYIAKTTNYQTADAIVTEAVRQSTASATGSFISKTTTYQTAESIVLTAETYATGKANTAESNAKSYANTKANTAENNAKSYADTQATAAENSAKSYANTQASAAESSAKSYANTQASAAESNAKSFATTKANTAENNAKNYTDTHAYAVVSGIEIVSAGVAITGNKYITLDVDANNYIHLTSSGIDMKGSRVSVDGNSMWARDDIIIMNPNDASSWRRSIAGIEAHMSGKHDWVLIAPYYDAVINYKGMTGESNSEAVNTSQFNQTEAYRSFGNGAAWYKYDITLIVRNYYGNIRQPNGLYVFLSNNPFTFTSGDRIAQARAQAAVEMSIASPTIAGGGVDTTFTMSYTSATGTNLCSEGATVYYYINGLNYTEMYLTSLTLQATTDTTTSRVPCTTYYYP